MPRSRLSLFIVLVMLLASLLSTEATEAMLRVAVGAAAADDDDAPYFTCSHIVTNISRAAATSPAKAARMGARISSSASSDSVVDEPTFSLPQLWAVLPPAATPRVTIAITAVARVAETRGPPARTGRFVRPPPRAPPLS